MILMSWDTREQVERFIDDKASTDQLIQWCPESEVDALVQHMKSEANRFWNIDPNISFKLAEGINALGYQYKDTSHVALGLMARGDARKYLGELQAAWDDLQKAGRLFRWICDDVGWARTRIGLLYICVELNQVNIILLQAQQAEEIFFQHRCWDWLINLYMNLGGVYAWLENPHFALTYYQKALEKALELGVDGEIYLGRLYLNIGHAYQELGDFRKAQFNLERAIVISQARGEYFWIPYAQQNLAYLAQATGHLRKALQLLESAQIVADNHSEFHSVQIREQRVSSFLKLNRYPEARALARAVISDYEHMEAGYSKALTLFGLATAEAALEHYDGANLALDNAEHLFRELNSELWLNRILVRRAAITLKQNDPETAFYLARQAASRYFTEDRPRQAAEALLIQGRALLKLGKLKQALTTATEAHRLSQEYQNANLSYSTHLLLGQLNEQLDSHHRAKRHYQAAVLTVDRVQKYLTITLRPDFLQDKSEAIRALLHSHLKAGNTRAAFETLERAKSQVFLGYLSSRDSLVWATDHPRSQQLIDELQNLREEHLWFYNLLQSDADSERISVEQTRQELAACEKRMRQITEQLYLYTEDLRVDIDLPNQLDIQAQLDQETCLIEYYNDGSSIWAFIVMHDQTYTCELSASVDWLDQKLSQLQFNISCALKAGLESPSTRHLGQQIQQLAAALHNKLLQPFFKNISSYSRLIIVPYGNLHYLPFHMLYTGQKYLIEHSEIVVLPAAGLLARRIPQRPQGALVLTHSHNGCLPQTTPEGEIVHHLFGGHLSSNDNAKRDVLCQNPVQVLHIAAHGKFRMDLPDLSYIHLEDGPLFTDDLLQQDLSYELVTLSACETGRATVAPGDELIGLGRGCLYAGAGALLVSQWRVEDNMTLALMESFYRGLLSGKSKATALQGAQCSLLDENPTLHPAYWGAFQLVGNAAPLSHF